jgi:hypothetical protein
MGGDSDKMREYNERQGLSRSDRLRLGGAGADNTKDR